MPLENPINFFQISLIHKENKLNDKASISTLSQEVPQSTPLSASLTVEAALVFPLFLFALVGMLFFFRMLQVTHITAVALAETGSWLSLEAEAEDMSLVKAVGYFQKELLEKECPCSYIVGDKLGIGWNGTDLEGEYVELQIHYQCRFPVRLFGIGNIPVAQRVRMKKWTGYHKGAESEGGERWVYITPNGTVYHVTRECTHLRLSIQTMAKQEAIGLGYTSCLLCGDEGRIYPYYYVTEEGKKYHTRLDCSGLKRTVYMIRFSEIGNRPACSRCGGG